MRFVKEVREEGITPENFEEYLGVGLYAGRQGSSEPETRRKMGQVANPVLPSWPMR
jgi:hypothetical protein